MRPVASMSSQGEYMGMALWDPSVMLHTALSRVSVSLMGAGQRRARSGVMVIWSGRT